VTNGDAVLWRTWLARRDQRAFASLVGPLMGFATGFARRLGCSSADADDVVQRCLVRLASETRAKPGSVGIRAWLGRDVLTEVRKSVRARDRRVAHELNAVPRAPTGLDAVDLKDAVDVALATLDDDSRLAVELRYLHDLEYREIATVLGTSALACRLRVHRALKRLRHTLGRSAPVIVAAWPRLDAAPIDAGSRIADAIASAGTIAPTSTTAVVLGGIAVAATWKIATAAAIVVLAGLFTWKATRPDEDPQPARVGAPSAKAPAEIGLAAAPRPLKQLQATNEIAMATASEDNASSATLDAAARGMIRVHGRITTDDGPGAGAVITVFRWDGQTPVLVETKTLGADGRYDVSIPTKQADDASAAAAKEKTSARIVVALRGFAPGAAWVVPAEPGATYERDIALERGLLSGVAKDRDGHPVVGVEIHARESYKMGDYAVEGAAFERDPEVGSAITDTSGRFELRGLPPTPQRLYTTSPDWFVTQPALFPGGTADAAVTLVPALSLSGWLRDAETHAPIDGTLIVNGVTRVVNADRTITASYRGFPTTARAGRFRCIVAAPATLAAGETLTLRVTPASPDYRDAERGVRFDADTRAQDVEVLLEHVGFADLIVEATTPAGAAFTGALDIRMVAQTGVFAERHIDPVVERAGRFRVAIPADRDWDLWITPALPLLASGISGFSHVQRFNMRVGERVEVRLVIPLFGSLRIHFPTGSSGVKLVSLDGKRGGELTLNMSPGIAPPEVGLSTSVTEGRWRVSLVDKPDTFRDVDVAPDAETVVDLR
jgi:RNA polymerase sigma factor (sigma-70 family)